MVAELLQVVVVEQEDIENLFQIQEQVVYLYLYKITIL